MSDGTTHVRLMELEPHWVGLFPGHAVGITFLCPHCRQVRLGVPFVPTIGEDLVFKMYVGARGLAFNFLDRNVDVVWQRVGETFESLTLTPSINAEASGHWHGFITGGEVR